MKKNIVKILLFLFIICGFTSYGFAEPPDYWDWDKPIKKEQRDRIRNRIETLKMWKLTKALDIDESTSAKLFPLLNRYDKKKAEIHYNLREGMRELRRYLDENRTDQLKDTLAMLEDNNRALQSINEEEWAEMKKVLTVEQQAKFVLFRREFDREVRKIISDARGRRIGKRR